MANYVSCDDCHKKVEGKGCPSGWFDIDLSMTQNLRSKDFVFFLCPDCYEKIVTPSPIGVLKRVLSFLNGRRT